MKQNSYFVDEKNATTAGLKVIKLKQSASKLTKGGSGHIPEYFVVTGVPITFYA